MCLWANCEIYYYVKSIPKTNGEFRIQKSLRACLRAYYHLHFVFWIVNYKFLDYDRNRVLNYRSLRRSLLNRFCSRIVFGSNHQIDYDEVFYPKCRTRMQKYFRGWLSNYASIMWFRECIMLEYILQFRSQTTRIQ